MHTDSPMTLLPSKWNLPALELTLLWLWIKLSYPPWPLPLLKQNSKGIGMLKPPTWPTSVLWGPPWSRACPLLSTWMTTTSAIGKLRSLWCYSGMGWHPGDDGNWGGRTDPSHWWLHLISMQELNVQPLSKSEEEETFHRRHPEIMSPSGSGWIQREIHAQVPGCSQH